MKLPALSAVAATLLIAACAGTPGDPWLADVTYAAGAAQGDSTLLRAHSDVKADCAVGPAPQIEILEQGTLGVARVAPATDVIVAPEQDCDGDEVAGAGVFYDANAGAVGIDRVVYRELRPGAEPDRTYAANIRVR